MPDTEEKDSALTETPVDDVDMDQENEAEEQNAEDHNEDDLPFAQGSDGIPRPKFTIYLSSPIVTLIIGLGDGHTMLTAHQALLQQSPYFADICKGFVDDGSVRSKPSRT